VNIRRQLWKPLSVFILDHCNERWDETNLDAIAATMDEDRSGHSVFKEFLAYLKSSPLSGSVHSLPWKLHYLAGTPVVKVVSSKCDEPMLAVTFFKHLTFFI